MRWPGGAWLVLFRMCLATNQIGPSFCFAPFGNTAIACMEVTDHSQWTFARQPAGMRIHIKLKCVCVNMLIYIAGDVLLLPWCRD
jgi:hypothetical protein